MHFKDGLEIVTGRHYLIPPYGEIMQRNYASSTISVASALVTSIVILISGCSSLKQEKATPVSLPVATGKPFADWVGSVKKIEDAITNNHDQPILYSFDSNHLIPVINYSFVASGSNPDSAGSSSITTFPDAEVLNQPAVLLVIPAFKGFENFPSLLGDRNIAADGSNRCENNPSAKIADGTLQTAELYTPAEAYSRLDKPDFIVNANYFDVRPQLNGQTWKSTKCSVPLGIYYDNNREGPTGGTHNSGEGDDKYFAGPRHYINEDGKIVSAVDTMIFHGVGASGTVRLITNDLKSSQALDVIRTLISRWTVGISGTSLFARTGSDVAPDAGGKHTTRVAVGYDATRDRLYIFEGGSYADGVSREQVAGLFRSLHVRDALELDGGGSASLAVSTAYARSVGGALPASSCQSLTGVWCSPVMVSDGPRPVPSWIGFRSYVAR